MTAMTNLRATAGAAVLSAAVAMCGAAHASAPKIVGSDTVAVCTATTGPATAACVAGWVALNEARAKKPFGKNGEIAKRATKARNWVGKRTGLQKAIKWLSARTGIKF